MEDRSTPILRSLIQLKDVLDQLVKAVSKQEKPTNSQRKEDIDGELRAVVRLPVEVTEYYASEEGDRRVRNQRDIVRVCLETAAVVAAIGLAILTFCSLRTLNGQLREMRTSNEQVKKQWEAQNIPWLGIEQPDSMPVSFYYKTLLPGTHRPFNYGVVTAFGAKTPKDFKTLSFTVCLLYQDGAQEWHYSGYRYRATGSQTVQVPGHSGWSYTQFTNASLLASNAE